MDVGFRRSATRVAELAPPRRPTSSRSSRPRSARSMSLKHSGHKKTSSAHRSTRSDSDDPPSRWVLERWLHAHTDGHAINCSDATESQLPKTPKPVAKRTKRALQNAAIEVNIFNFTSSWSADTLQRDRLSPTMMKKDPASQQRGVALPLEGNPRLP